MFIPHSQLVKYVAKLSISLISGAAMILLKDYLFTRKRRKGMR